MTDFEPSVLWQRSPWEMSLTNEKQTAFLCRTACVWTGKLLRVGIKQSFKALFYKWKYQQESGGFGWGALTNHTRCLCLFFWWLIPFENPSQSTWITPGNGIYTSKLPACLQTHPQPCLFLIATSIKSLSLLHLAASSPSWMVGSAGVSPRLLFMVPTLWKRNKI